MIEQPVLFNVQPTPYPDAYRSRSRRKPRAEADNRGRHISSLEAHDASGAAIGERRRMVLEWVRGHGPCTDREIRNGLFGERADMNAVRPRVSELLNAGELIERGRVPDAATGRLVRRVDVRRDFLQTL